MPTTIYYSPKNKPKSIDCFSSACFCRVCVILQKFQRLFSFLIVDLSNGAPAVDSGADHLGNGNGEDSIADEINATLAEVDAAEFDMDDLDQDNLEELDEDWGLDS